MSQEEFEKNTRTLVTLAGYGNFLALWSTFEIILEILIMRELRLTSEETSIVCTGKAVDGKMTMLQALLRRDPEKAKGIGLLTTARAIAKRNSFVHGFFRVDHSNGDLYLISRDVKSEYSASSERLNHKSMDAHVEQFEQKFVEVKHHFGISDEEIDAYTQPIFALAQAPKSQKPKKGR
jgi:hypothetical protein